MLTSLSHSALTSLSRSALTSLSHSALTSLTHSALTPLSHSALTSLSHSALTSLSHSALTSLSRSALTSLSDSALTPLSHSALTSLSHSALTSLSHSALTPLSHSALTSLSHSALTPLSHSALTPLSHSALASLSHSALTSLSHSALTPLSHSAFGQDYAASNFLASATSVVAAAILSRKFFYTPYYKRILQKDKPCCSVCWKYLNKAGLTPAGYWVFEETLPRLQQLADPNCLDVEAIQLTAQEEHALVGTIVDEENWNIWALLMPTVYQLVPGSMIAKLWFNALFPPTSDMADYDAQNNVSYNLMVIATSLALGLVFGLAFTRFIRRAYRGIKVCCGGKDTEPSGSWNDSSFYEDPDVDRTSSG